MQLTGRRLSVSLVVVPLLLSLSACAADSTVDSTADSAAATSVETTTSTGASAQWSAPLVGGGTYDLAGTPLERPVALWFWAPG